MEMKLVKINPINNREYAVASLNKFIRYKGKTANDKQKQLQEK